MTERVEKGTEKGTEPFSGIDVPAKKGSVPFSLLLLLATAAFGQGMPRLQAVFPPGGKAGTTVQVVFRGGLGGAHDLIVDGGGITGQIASQAGKGDPAARKLFAARCSTCHELRSPENRQMTPPQWEATVDRMITRNNADIPRADRDKIVEYLKAESAAGQVTAALTIAPNAPPGRRELRLVTPNGVSTAFPFFVSSLDETLEQEPNDTPEKAQALSLPVVVNGGCEKGGDVDCYRFTAKAGQRLTFRVRAYQLNPDCQNYFSPMLELYDGDHHLLAKNLGFEDLDPLLDTTVPKDGTYVVQVRDLMYRGGPADVYRLEAGELGYHQVIYPLGAQRGSPFDAIVFSDNQPRRPWKSELAKTTPLGPMDLETPFGLFRFLIGDYPEAFDPGAAGVHHLSIPCSLNGWIGAPGEVDRYVFDVTRDEVRTLAPWVLAGPFDAAEGGLDQVYAAETDGLAGRVDPGRSYPLKKGQGGWTAGVPNAEGAYAFPAGNNEVWYAWHTFTMKQDAAGLLSLGTDDGCKAWVNGQLVHVYRGTRPVRPASDLVPIRLKRGPNTILLKVLNAAGVGGFTASAGAWSIDVWARRLGSPLKPKLKLGFGKGWLFESAGNGDGGSHPGGDVRCDWSFTQPGEYGLQLEDEDGRGGERYAYRVEIGPAQPEASLVAWPANPSVPPGGQFPVVVERTSLSGYDGDVPLRFEGLPPGLTAEDAILPADTGSTVVVLTAAPDAKPAAAALKVTGQVPSPTGPIEFPAEAQDFFRIQNNALPIPRRSLAAAILPQPAPYTLTVTPERVEVHPGKTAELTVQVARRPDFTGDLTLIVRGAPPGVGSSPVFLPGNRAKITLPLAFTNGLRNNPFGESLVPDAYRCVVVGLAGGDGLTGGLMYCSNPVVLQPFDPAREPKAATPKPSTGGPEPDTGAGRRLMEQRCTKCHALIDPEQTKKPFAEWQATVDRMIGKGAQLNGMEREQVLAYLRAVTAKQGK